MLTYKLLFLSLICSLVVNSQSVFPAGARSMSLANSTVALTDEWAYFNNPGALGAISDAKISTSFENRYFIKELQTNSFVYIQPLKVGVLSVGFQTFGFQLYRKGSIGAGYSLKLSEKLFAGVQLNYHTLRITDYGSTGKATAEVGLLAKLTENTDLGIAVFNANRVRIAEDQDERLATFMRIGLQHRISKKVNVLLEAEKEVKSALRVKGALEYELASRFYFRFGAATKPIEVTSGFGYGFKNNLRIDIGTAYHQQLGFSPHVGISFDFVKKTNG